MPDVASPRCVGWWAQLRDYTDPQLCVWVEEEEDGVAVCAAANHSAYWREWSAGAPRGAGMYRLHRDGDARPRSDRDAAEELAAALDAVAVVRFGVQVQ
eukprot:gene51197-3635_t